VPTQLMTASSSKYPTIRCAVLADIRYSRKKKL
jgi:hypothetical protein